MMKFYNFLHSLLRPALLLVALAGAVEPMAAYDFQEGGIFYNVNSDGASVTVTYETTNYNSYSGEVVIPNFVTHDGTTYTVRTIGENAFRECDGLTSIVIADSVNKMQKYAFLQCTNLQHVTIGESLTSLSYRKAGVRYPAFAGCDNITSLIWNARSCAMDGGMTILNLEQLTVGPNVKSLPNLSTDSLIKLVWNAIAINEGSPVSLFPNLQVAIIGDGVQALPRFFISGSQVSSLEIPNSVTCIYYGAFAQCKNLDGITLPNSLTGISGELFNGCTALTSINIPETVTYIGEKAFRNCSGLSSINIPNAVDSIGEGAFSGCTGLTGTVIIPNGITAISDSLFFDCANLEHIILPNTVTSIGHEAFSGCSGLSEFTIPKGVNAIGDGAFVGCSGLTSITIPEGVNTIGFGAFSCCTGLTSIHIPASVDSIGTYSFGYCPGITRITVDDANPTYDSRNGCNAIIETSSNKLISGCQSTIIPNSVLTIGELAFCFCPSLTNIVIPNSVMTIEGSAFWGCSGLTSIMIPSSVTSIDPSSFAGYSGLTRMVVADGNPVYDSRDNCNAIIVTGTNTLITGCQATVVPNTVKTIGEYSFQLCTGLTEIDIPESVTAIDPVAFYGCTNLKNIQLGDSLETIGFYAFYGCSSLQEVIIPNSVKLIEDNAFEGCTGMTNLIIGEAVDTIGTRAFWKCTSLTKVTIPNSVSDLGFMTFQDCTGLNNVTIGSGVTEMNAVFSGCDDLESITCYATVPPRLVILSERKDGKIIKYSNFSAEVEGKATLYVPAGAVAAYQSALYWRNFSRIVPIPATPGDVNNDGEVNIADINSLIDAILGENHDISQDVNGDGEVNIADINSVVETILNGPAM